MEKGEQREEVRKRKNSHEGTEAQRPNGKTEDNLHNDTEGKKKEEEVKIKNQKRGVVVTKPAASNEVKGKKEEMGSYLPLFT